VARTLRDEGCVQPLRWRQEVFMLGRQVSSKQVAVLEERARQMRHLQTSSEARLWSALRSGQLGVSFKRQVIFGRFIVDFAAPAAKLVVEVDGSRHASSARQRADERRDRWLRAQGYRVVRVQAALVLRALPEAVAVVREALARAQ
jgi:very-short-patch-repair endonuclease